MQHKNISFILYSIYFVYLFIFLTVVFILLFLHVDFFKRTIYVILFFVSIAISLLFPLITFLYYFFRKEPKDEYGNNNSFSIDQGKSINEVINDKN